MRTIVVAAMLVVTPGVIAACSLGEERAAPRGVCEAIAAFDEEVQVASDEEQQRLLEDVVATAPAAIRPAAERLLEGYERLEAGEDPEDVIADEDRYNRAADKLLRYGIDNCGLRDQRQPGGI